MIDLAMVSDERRRLRSCMVGITKSPSFQNRSFGHAAVVAACVSVAGCSAQNGAQGPVASAANPAAQVAVAPGTTAAEAKTAESTATGKAVAALTKPVAIVGRGITAAGRKVATVGVGLASWYGGKFHGRRTANGEKFDMEALTAAHPSLPLPSYVRVTNVSNGRSVVVRVNDRGPFHGGRLIDVSRRTADVLGFRGSGVGNVKVDYVGPADNGDDRKLIATYQEFGRPAAPEGMQMAALHPVSEAELLGRAPSTMLASAQPMKTLPQTTAIAEDVTTMPVGLHGASEAVVAYAPQPTTTQASALGQPLKVAALRPAAPQPQVQTAGPQLASLPQKSEALKAEPATSAEPVKGDAAKAMTLKATTPKTDGAKAASPAAVKRVVRAADPVLASSTPAFADVAPMPAAEASKPKSAVSARIAASFEGFDAFPPARDDAGVFNGLR